MYPTLSDSYEVRNNKKLWAKHERIKNNLSASNQCDTKIANVSMCWPCFDESTGCLKKVICVTSVKVVNDVQAQSD